MFVLGCQPLDPASLNAGDEVAARITTPTLQPVKQLTTVFTPHQQIRLGSSMPRGLETRRASALSLIRPQFVATRHDMAKLAPLSSLAASSSACLEGIGDPSSARVHVIVNNSQPTYLS